MNFNETLYLAANPDVAVAVKNGKFSSGQEHWQKYGKKEGRPLGRIKKNLSRNEKIFYCLDAKGLGLEIGPSHNPIAPKRKGFNVHILDHVTDNELRSKYKDHNVNLDNIEEVDFVWHGEPLPELIGKTECYDWIIASHVIEHTPDFITFLQHCEALLKPEGVLSLVIPDKRYCFDYFSSLSETGHLLDAWEAKRVRPSAGQIFDHFANAAKRNNCISWGVNDKGGADELVHSIDVAKAHWLQATSTKEYTDVHCWRFTPTSFRLIISDLRKLNLINLNINGEFDTSGCEFYVSLSKGSEIERTEERFFCLKKRIEENFIC